MILTAFFVFLGNFCEEIEVSSHDLKRDGLKYYSVNWGSKKPFVLLHNKWEDCSNRIGTLNVMVHHLDQLVYEKAINVSVYLILNTHYVKLSPHMKSIDTTVALIHMYNSFDSLMHILPAVHCCHIGKKFLRGSSVC